MMQTRAADAVGAMLAGPAASDLGPSGPDPSGGDPPERSAGDLALWSGQDLGWEDLVDEARRIGPDPTLLAMTDGDLERDLCGVASQLAALTARWLLLLSEFVIRGVWADQGARTPAEWLSWKVGLAPSTAREHVRIALRLRELPKVRAAFEAGTLSYSKVRAMTRIAVPEIEDLVLQWADVSTAAQLERISADLRATRRATRHDHPIEEQGREPTYGWRTRSNLDGTMTITMTCPVEEGAELCEALQRHVQAASAATHGADGEPEKEGIPPQTDGGVSESAWPPPDPRGPRASAAALFGELLGMVLQADSQRSRDPSGLDRHTLVLHAAFEDLQSADAHELDPAANPPRRCEPGRAGPDSPNPRPADTIVVHDANGRVRALRRSVLRRLACEAGIVLAAVDGDGTPIDLGRRHRRPHAALRRAVHLRDSTCTFPGCGATRHLHIHHVQHWADGGSTDLGNLVLVCGHHHRFVHTSGWNIEVRRSGQHRYSPPGGAALDRVPRLAAAPSAAALGRPEDAVPDALQPGFVDDFRRADRETVIQVLLQEVARAAPDLAAAA